VNNNGVKSSDIPSSQFLTFYFHPQMPDAFDHKTTFEFYKKYTGNSTAGLTSFIAWLNIRIKPISSIEIYIYNTSDVSM
jgi:hypothetical protein